MRGVSRDVVAPLGRVRRPRRRSGCWVWALAVVMGLSGCVALAGVGLWQTRGAWRAVAHQAMRAARRGMRGAERARERVRSRQTVADRVRMHGASARSKLRPHFKRAGVAYPPAQIAFAAFKRERRLDLYASATDDGPMVWITSYPILGASGKLGPKLKEGDRQVPEGHYRIDWLHPNSSNHLAMHVNYPNASDRAQARRDKRTNLGGAIFVHGKTTSAGCLAMGDDVIEELFVVAADADQGDIDLWISPVDFRARRMSKRALKRQPRWVRKRYRALARALDALPAPRVWKRPR